MAAMTTRTTARWEKSVRSFTMMFIPYTDYSAVIGSAHQSAMRSWSSQRGAMAPAPFPPDHAIVIVVS
jgi:hypothetical protein